MIPLGNIVMWRRLAVFQSATTACFAIGAKQCTKGHEVWPSSRRRTSVCQNRYPSPSRWPVQRILSGSPWFWRGAAGFRQSLMNVMTPWSKERLNKGHHSWFQRKGSTSCERSHHLPCSPRLDLRPATKSIPTLSAPRSALPLVVWPARFWSTVDALKAQLLAVPLALSRTTSKRLWSASRSKRADNTGRSTFVIAYHGVKSLFVAKGKTLKHKRGTLSCRRQNHSSLPQRSLGWLHAHKALIWNAPRLAVAWVALLANSSKTVSASPARQSALPAALWPTTSTCKGGLIKIHPAAFVAGCKRPGGHLFQNFKINQGCTAPLLACSKDI